MSRKKSPEELSTAELEQLLYAVRQTAEGKRADSDEEVSEDDPTTGGLVWRINSALRGSQIFNDHENLELEELFKPGQCTVIQLNEVDQRQQHNRSEECDDDCG